MWRERIRPPHPLAPGLPASRARSQLSATSPIPPRVAPLSISRWPVSFMKKEPPVIPIVLFETTRRDWSSSWRSPPKAAARSQSV